MEVFWRHGFVATSMSDIYAATGLKPGNLYATFKDKDELFRQAFQAYVGHFRNSIPVGLEGRAAVVAWLETQARLATQDPERKGCLIMNTIIERDAHSPQTQAMAATRMAEVRAFFSDHLERAAAKGELPAGANIERLADALVGIIMATMALARGGAPDDMVWNIAAEGARMVGDSTLLDRRGGRAG